MRKPTKDDCTDEHGSVDLECYLEAMDKYEEEIRTLQWELNVDYKFTCKETYEKLVAQYREDYEYHFNTIDTLNRKANAYAVANTPRIWREQF